MRHNEEVQRCTLIINEMEKTVNEIKYELSNKEQLAIEYEKSLKEIGALKKQNESLKSPGKKLIGIRNNPEMNISSFVPSDFTNSMHYKGKILAATVKELK